VRTVHHNISTNVRTDGRTYDHTVRTYHGTYVRTTYVSENYHLTLQYGRVNKAARDWLDTLAPEPGEKVRQDDHPWNPRTRTTTETVVREAMQALVRVQAHMLARIVVEIRAADIAVELEP
jgi:hypothetical protein